VHNQDVANHESGDLGHFVFNYEKVWSNPETRPHASIQTKVYDWKTYYASRGMKALMGLTKTAYDNYAVRAFCASLGKNGLVDLKYKMDPGTEGDWRGQDGHAGSAGFSVLPKATTGVPLEVVGKKILVKEKFARDILNMARHLEPFGLVASAEANFEAASTGCIPMIQKVERATPDGQWGPLYTTGSIAECQGNVRLVEQVWWPHPEETQPTIWALPVATKELATSNQFHFSRDKARLEGMPIAYVRLEGTQIVDAPNYMHPHNVARRENEPIGLAKKRAPKKDKRGRWHDTQYILDFKGCKKGWFAAVKVTNEKTQKFSIEVYKIKRVDNDNEEFDGVMYLSTGDQLTDECLQAQWHAPKKAPIKQAIDNDTVLNYFEKLTKKCALPAKTVTDIEENGIYKPLESGSSDDGEDEVGMFEEEDRESSDSQQDGA
jgi:hypothetical protein